MATIADLVNFTQTTKQVTLTQTVWVCGVCGSNEVTVSDNGEGQIIAICFNCGTTEIQPAPSAISQAQTQAAFTATKTTATV